VKEHRSYPKEKKIKFPEEYTFFCFGFWFFWAAFVTPLIRSDSLSSRVGVHLSLSAGHGNIDESTGVENSLLSTALGLLGLFLGLNLGSLRLDFTGTSE